MIEIETQNTSYRWYMLALSTLTNALVVAAPSMALPVLFSDMARDLHLNLVQIGLVWGISALPGIFTVLLGGAISDRFGPKRVLIAGCLLVGLTGGLRGLVVDFPTLMAAMLLFGVFSPLISMNTLKACSTWFPRHQLGLASGVLSMGMAVGFLFGSMFSATLISPWLGGWRMVLYFYGAISIFLLIPWYFTRSLAGYSSRAVSSTGHKSLRQTVAHVGRIRNIWLFGLAMFGVGGGIQGTLGYLPLYLRGLGWADPSADGALAAFHTVSMLFVVPIALASDRLGTRKKVLVVACILFVFGIGMLSVAGGPLVWLMVVIAGFARDGFMAVFLTLVIETDGVGAAYAGTATGMVMVFGSIGSVLGPPLGNSLATVTPGMPFILWAALVLVGLGGILASREQRMRPALVVE